MMKKIGLSVLLAALVAAPLASANHGLNGRLVGTLDDGSIVNAGLFYITGNFNAQTWGFTFTGADGTQTTCNAYGSLEIGFTSLAGCAFTFSTGPTGDSHGYPYGSADVHAVAVTINGVSGSAQQVVCADSGPAGTACNTALGVL